MPWAKNRIRKIPCLFAWRQRLAHLFREVWALHDCFISLCTVQAGHGAGKPTSKIIEEITDIYSFLSLALGVEWKGWILVDGLKFEIKRTRKIQNSLLFWDLLYDWIQNCKIGSSCLWLGWLFFFFQPFPILAFPFLGFVWMALRQIVLWLTKLIYACKLQPSSQPVRTSAQQLAVHSSYQHVALFSRLTGSFAASG